MSDLAESPTPTGGTVATPETAPTPTGGTVQPNGDAGNGQGASVEETFGNVDPRTLPPALKAVYDNMLRGFKEKTTKLSETTKAEVAKATESYKQKADLYEQLASQQEFVDQWNQYVASKNSAAEDVAKSTDSPELAEMKAELQELKQTQQRTENLQLTEAFADAVDEKGQKIHPDFDKLNSLDIGVRQNGDRQDPYSFLRAAIELAPGKTPQEKLANGYKKAKEVYDAIVEEGRKLGMGRVQAKLQGSTQLPSGSLPPGALTTTTKKPQTGREAMELARQGVLVSRD